MQSIDGVCSSCLGEGPSVNKIPLSTVAGPLCVFLYTARDVGALELSLDPKSKQGRVDNSPQQGPLKGPKQERVIVIKTNFQVSKYPGLREFINFKPSEHDLESLFELLSNKFELI